MRSFRIIDLIQRDSVLSGQSAAMSGGRWNPRGIPMIYTSLTVSLAVLELCCHYECPFQHGSYAVATIEIPDQDITIIARDELPPRWSTCQRATQDLGQRWLRSGTTALQVPSAVHGFEDNLLLNPQHADFARVRLLSVQSIRVDDRVHRNSRAAAG